MDRREMEYIIVIAQEKNLSKAAERLYVSQPALSRFLLKLEDQAGMPLFERKKRQLIPTVAGELYLDTARKMLQLEQDLDKKIKRLREGTHGKLSIGITPGRGRTVLPRVLPAFQKAYPDYELSILEDDVQTLEQALASGAIEICFYTMSERDRLTQPRFRCKLICREEIILCAPKNGHYELLAKEVPDRKYPWIDLKYLENDCFLLLKKQMRLGQLAAKILEDHSISPKTVELSSIDTALELVAQQYGVAFASNFRIEEHASADRISLFCFGDHPETWDFVAAFGKDYSPAPPDRYLIELIQSLY